MDLTPAQDRCVHCAELGHSDCVRGAYQLGYQAGREDAARAVEKFGERLVCHECGPDVVGFAAAARGDQPRTVEEAVGDNPEEQQ